MKTPDEIKKGLGEAIAEASWVVDDGDMHDLRNACDTARKIMADALAYIQQLEAERDAAVEHLWSAAEHGGVCIGCKHDADEAEAMEHCQSIDFDCPSCEDKCPCYSCEKGSNFEWCGVQKEESS